MVFLQLARPSRQPSEICARTLQGAVPGRQARRIPGQIQGKAGECTRDMVMYFLALDLSEVLVLSRSSMPVSPKSVLIRVLKRFESCNYVLETGNPRRETCFASARFINNKEHNIII